MAVMAKLHVRHMHCALVSGTLLIVQSVVHSENQPLTRVSIPQHEPSEAWGGTGSWHHNGSGFTIATVGPGPLLLLMLPLPYTRQLSHWGGGTGSVTPEWAEWLPLLVPGAGAAPISL